MEIQQLRHVLAAAQASNYSQAAKKCFTSRQNIAHSVKVIENELDVTMFNREGSEMVLTPEGKRVVRQAGEIIAKIDELRVMFYGAGTLALPLNLAVGTNLLAGLPPGGTELIAQHPGGVHLFELSCEECYHYVCSGKADAALIMCMEQEFPQCSAFEVSNSISYALTSVESPLARLSHASVGDLVSQKLLIMSEQDFQYRQLFEAFKALGAEQVDVSVIASTSSMLHLVKRMHAVGFVSEQFAVHQPEGTAVVPIFDQRLNWHFYLLYQARGNSSHSAMKLAQGIQRLFHESRENVRGGGQVRNNHVPDMPWRKSSQPGGQLDLRWRKSWPAPAKPASQQPHVLRVVL